VEAPALLGSVGHGGTIQDIEKYLCRLYGCSSNDEHDPDVDTCRHRLFLKAKKALEFLPPTKDALDLHLQRANYQAKIWINAGDASYKAEDPIATGAWEEVTGNMTPFGSGSPLFHRLAYSLCLATVRQSAARQDVLVTKANKCACMRVAVKPRTVPIPLQTLINYCIRYIICLRPTGFSNVPFVTVIFN